MKSFNSYKLIHKILCFIFIGLVPCLTFGEGKIVEANTPTAESDNFVTCEGNKLMLNGCEYRAIGVNIPNLHMSYFGTWLHNIQMYDSHKKAKKAMITAVKSAANNGFKFIRFFANPGYPKSIDLLYAKNPDKYWKLMDEVFALCHENKLKLIPSFNMLPGWFPDYYQEPAQAILDPKSKSHKAAYKYINDFVHRYKDDPNILMWELCNEAMLHADVDFAGQKSLPDECFTDSKNKRKLKTRKDSLTWDMYIRLYKEQTAFIKKIDSNHLVTSGDASVRYECTSRRETFPDFKIRDDTFREWIGNNILSQPEPLDVYSYHFYVSPEKRWGMPALKWMKNLIIATLATETPVFIGELGQENPSFQDDHKAKATCAFIDMAEKNGVSLIALWVWHFNWQPDRDIRNETHPLLIKHCQAFNIKYSNGK